MTGSDDRVALIVNARARRGRDWFERVRAEVDRGPLHLWQSTLAHSTDEADDALRTALGAGVRRIAIGGGDGTFTHLAHHFAHRDFVLGVLPLGTGNAFARDLGVPVHPERAARLMWEGRESLVDLGTVADSTFLNLVTVGMTTRIAEYLEPGAKRRFGRLVYLLSLSRALVVVRPFHAKLETGEGCYEFDSLQVVIGNGRYHAGPLLLAPEAAIDEGRLSIYALQGRNRANFVKLAWRLRTGRHVELNEVFALSTTGGRLTTTPTKRVTIDGEISGRTPVDFGLLPGALRVFRPAADTTK